MEGRGRAADDLVSEALETATRAARGAGRIIADGLDRPGWVKEKGRADPVTEIDVRAELAILDAIRATFPDHDVLSEEAGRSGTGHSYTWFVDPLDGTRNFVSGLPAFSVSIGMAYEGSMAVSVVYDPIRSEMFTAARGGGAFLNGERLRPGRGTVRRGLSDAVVDVELGSLMYEAAALALWAELPDKVGGVRGLGSTALSLAYTACGRLDASWICTPHAWDYAAGSLLATEAGCAVRAWNWPYDVMGGSGVLAGERFVVDELWDLLNFHSRRGSD